MARHAAADLFVDCSGFKGLLEGAYDTMPENAFYMNGNIDECVEEAERLMAIE